MEDQEIIKDFLVESGENLARLDLEMVGLEKAPDDASLLASIFRTFHTIKGTCGFLGFDRLEKLAHIAENILSEVRNGERSLTPTLVSLILETVDAIKEELAAIEQTGSQSGQEHEDLLDRLTRACAGEQVAVPSAPVAPPPAEAPEIPAAPSAAEPAAPAAAAPEAGATEQKVGPPKAGAAIDSSIRVDVGLLDKLMNLVGELVLARNQILQYNATQENATLNATSQRLNLITTQLQEGVMKTRMQPIGMVWNKLPRVVRDLAASCGKQIALEMDGAETELDKSIIEAIKDPLTHIVRNCCDHGIEMPAVRAAAGKPAQGTLSLRSFHEGGQVNIEIADDGGGIDHLKIKEAAVRKGIVRPDYAERMGEREALQLIFLPGFSMAEQVTSISGRGVGMDVVKTNIEKIGGTVDVVSAVGEGTTVKIKIPLTLAIIPGLVVTMGDRRSAPREREVGRNGERFVIPQVSLQELIRLEGDAARKQIESIHGTPVYRRRGHLLPIVYLDEVLQLERESRGGDIVNIVVLQAEERQFGLVVDGISDTQEIVVKPLGKQLKGLTCYAGATIMGDGKVALILDVLGIGQRAGVVAAAHEQSRVETDHRDQAEAGRQTFLLFRSARFERVAVPLSLVARLEEIPQARIEQAGARKVVQYRGEILPLINLGAALDSGTPDTSSQADPAQVIVFHNGERRIGLLVDQIVDIIEETIAVRRAVDRPGLLGSAVIGGRVTDLLDLHAVIEGLDAQWFGGAQRQGGAGVLVADPSAFARGLIRAYLEMAGCRVFEAVSADKALAQLDRHAVDVVLAALELPPRGAAGLAERLRGQARLSRIPVVGLVEQLKDLEDGERRLEGLQCYRQKYDRASVLEVIEQATGAREAGELATAGDRR
jgi:two-component system chemotaxis sensor kinase CheA